MKPRHIEDIKRLQMILRQVGYFNIIKCTHIWEKYSHLKGDDWLEVPQEDSVVLKELQEYNLV